MHARSPKSAFLSELNNEVMAISVFSMSLVGILAAASLNFHTYSLDDYAYN